MTTRSAPRSFQSRDNNTVLMRPMEASDLSVALGWAANEGWNPGREDAEAFLQADPDGFFMAFVDGKPVAAISVVNHTDSFAFLGLYLCLPACRGQGIGFTLWQYALEHAGDRTVGLDGVPDQQDNYRKSGFVLTDQTFRYEGIVEGSGNPDVREAVAEDFPVLAALVGEAQGYDTSGFLEGWFTQTGSRKTLVLERNGKIAGLVTCRACLQGFKIGPLVADTLEDAKTLLHASAEGAKSSGLIVDVPVSGKALTAYCQSLGMIPSFNTARMYKGAPPVSGQSVFSISTMELG